MSLIRRAIWFAALTGLLVVAVFWSRGHYLEARRAARAAVAGQRTCQELASSVDRLRRAAALGTQETEPDTDALVHMALKKSGAEPDRVLVSSRQGRLQKVGPYYSKGSVHMTLRDLTLGQTLRFLYHLEKANPALTTEAFHLARMDESDSWRIDPLTVSYLIYRAPETAPNRRLTQRR